jgi:acyl-CoA synthetase (AMP-forming)/AMP-acid ligase II
MLDVRSALRRSAQFHAEVAGLAADLPDLDHVVVRDEGYEQWLASFPATDPDPAIDPDDFYVIRHSAGTTGVPKGIAFSHRAWMNTERNWTFLLPPLELGDHCTHVAPISHGSGYLFVPAWLAGGVNVLEPRFDAARVMALVGGYVFGVPTMVADLVAQAREAGTGGDFGRLKAFVVSGAPILPQTALAARDLFGPRLYQMYGQTECVPAAFMGPVEWFGEVPGSEPLRSCGRGGYNIWPAELEMVIAALPGVREVAVIGVPHPRWGETAMALVVAEDGCGLSAEDVIGACRDRLGSYKKPTAVRLQAEPLARTPLGKISRKALREPFWADGGQRVGGT